MKRSEIDRSKLSPMMKHYVELKDKYEDTIILYRLGDFYEMFFEDWHFRYLGIDLATKIYESKLTYDEYIARGMLKEK